MVIHEYDSRSSYFQKPKTKEYLKVGFIVIFMPHWKCLISRPPLNTTKNEGCENHFSEWNFPKIIYGIGQFGENVYEKILHMDDFVVSQNVLRVIITNDISARQNYDIFLLFILTKSTLPRKYMY